MKFTNSLSTIFPSAIIVSTLATSGSVVTNAMPVNHEKRTLCSEAARFGGFSVTPTTNLKIGDTVTFTYVQHCPQIEDIYPSSLSVAIGGSGSQAGTPFVQIGRAHV